MKDSGIEWIGEIPQGWKIKPIKSVFNIGRGRVIAKTELNNKGTYPIYSSQTKNRGIMGYIDTYDFDTTQLTWTTDGANAGTVFLRKGKHNCTNVCGTLQPKLNNFDMQFAEYAVNHVAFYNKRADTNGYKIMNNEMANIQFALPPYETQQKIAAYLDEKVALIDNIIEKTKESIEEYKRYKQSLITETVTKGLNKNAKMKDSGIEWIGEIPEGWEVGRLKNFGEAIIGLTYSPQDVEGSGIMVLRSSNVQGGIIDLSDRVYVNSEVKGRLLLKKDDILICSRNGSRSLIGKCALISDEAIGKTFGAFMTVYRSRFNQFIYYVLNSNIFNFHLGTFLTSTINQLTTGNLNGIKIPLPPEKEQNQIVDFLKNKSVELDVIMQKKSILIEELTQYKKSLIYEVVTGKKEV